jgi:hypothetical protein
VGSGGTVPEFTEQVNVLKKIYASLEHLADPDAAPQPLIITEQTAEDQDFTDLATRKHDKALEVQKDRLNHWSHASTIEEYKSNIQRDLQGDLSVLVDHVIVEYRDPGVHRHPFTLVDLPGKHYLITTDYFANCYQALETQIPCDKGFPTMRSRQCT